MRSRTDIDQAIALAAAGLNASQIAHSLSLPRSTIRMWLSGQIPTSYGQTSSCSECGAAAHDYAGLPREYVYLLGLYLGDGCISAHRRQVYRLRICLDTAHPAIIGECEAAIRAVLPTNRVGRRLRGGGFENSAAAGSVEISSYSRAWPCLLPQHGPGVKHSRSIALVDWQVALVDQDPEALLRGLIHSDGCRFINTGTNWRHPRYSFSNVSDDIRTIFCDACDRLGVRWTTAPRTVYVSRKDDVARLDEFIGPKC